MFFINQKTYRNRKKKSLADYFCEDIMPGNWKHWRAKKQIAMRDEQKEFFNEHENETEARK